MHKYDGSIYNWSIHFWSRFIYHQPLLKIYLYWSKLSAHIILYIFYCANQNSYCIYKYYKSKTRYFWLWVYTDIHKTVIYSWLVREEFRKKKTFQENIVRVYVYKKICMYIHQTKEAYKYTFVRFRCNV